MEGIISGVLGSIELTCHGQQIAGLCSIQDQLQVRKCCTFSYLSAKHKYIQTDFGIKRTYTDCYFKDLQRAKANTKNDQFRYMQTSQ